MFQTHAYELHRRHRPNILIIIEPRIAEAKAQAVIDTLLYSHSRRVDPASFSGGIWLLWNKGPSFIVKIITYNDHSIHALVKVSSPSFSFLFTAIYAPHILISINLFGTIYKILLRIFLFYGSSLGILMICFLMKKN